MLDTATLPSNIKYMSFDIYEHLFHITSTYNRDIFLLLYHKMPKTGNIFNKVKRKIFCFAEYSIFTESTQATN